MLVAYPDPAVWRNGEPTSHRQASDGLLVIARYLVIPKNPTSERVGDIYAACLDRNRDERFSHYFLISRGRPRWIVWWSRIGIS